jgi:hypothetical protein
MPDSMFDQQAGLSLAKRRNHRQKWVHLPGAGVAERDLLIEFVAVVLRMK